MRKALPKIPKGLDRAVAFFEQHAGVGYRPDRETLAVGRRRGAIALARAEARAQRRGVKFDWQDDDERAYCYCDSPDCPYHEGGSKDMGEGWDTLYCVAWEPCACSRAGMVPHRNILASLCGIMDPSAEYRRVVEAELACEFTK